MSSESHTDSSHPLCKELCTADVSSKIACHTFHLNKPAVFSLQNGDRKVVKSVIKLEDREMPSNEASGEEEEVSCSVFYYNYFYAAGMGHFSQCRSVFFNEQMVFHY